MWKVDPNTKSLKNYSYTAFIAILSQPVYFTDRFIQQDFKEYLLTSKLVSSKLF